MASAASNCIYKSVTLAVDETFTLPPGAEIVSSSGGLQAFTSTCPKPTDLETPECYTVTFQSADASRVTPPYEFVDIQGIKIGATTYPFTNGSFQFGQVANASTFATILNSRIASTTIGPLITGGRVVQAGRNGGRGEYFVFQFNTIPSIGDPNMSFYAYASGGAISNSPGAAISFLVKKC